MTKREKKIMRDTVYMKLRSASKIKNGVAQMQHKDGSIIITKQYEKPFCVNVNTIDKQFVVNIHSIQRFKALMKKSCNFKEFVEVLKNRR